MSLSVRLVLPCLLAAACATSSAHADTLYASYLAPGVQASSDSTYVETFDNATISNGQYVTTFNGSGVTGTYSGSFQLPSADVWGGANGKGQYITTNTSYTLSLSKGVNYFGMWFSALDQGNQLSFYNGSNLLFSFTPQQYQTLVGACPTTAPSPNYCGNPNSNESGNSSQQYAFLNFYDQSGGTFNKIVFTENPQVGGFESDNHTVGNLNSAPGGTPITATPEPGTLTLMGSGLAGVAGMLRRRHRRA